MEVLGDTLQAQTSEIWHMIAQVFPEADIRFQREEGSTTLHILVRDQETPLEHLLAIDLENANAAAIEAVFSIKEVLKHFDS